MNCVQEDLEIIQDYRKITHKFIQLLVKIKDEDKMKEEL